jgi:transcriptional regulator PpsR
MLMTPFQAPERYMKGISSRLTADLLASSNDISLVVDDQGIVRDLGIGGSSDLADEFGHLLGQDWLESVAPDSRKKIHDLMAVTAETAPSNWRQVNHPSADKEDIPVLYRVLTRDDHGNLIVVGRDLRAIAELQQQLLDVQHSMERDYARLHQAETRYRMLFTLATEGILIVNAETRRVVEANPAAGRVFERPVGKLVGRSFPLGFDEAGSRMLEDHLVQVKAAGNADEIVLHLEDDPDLTVRVRATLLRREDGLYFLVRLTPHAEGGGDARFHPLIEVVKRSPDAFVVTDPDGVVLAANKAFLELVQVGSEVQAKGQSLERWVGRSGVDFDLLRKNLSKRTQLRQFATSLRPEFGESIDVELSGVAALDARQPCLGFVIRRSMKKPTSNAPMPDEPLAESIRDMTELIGRVPLKDLVRETSDIIERLCIEAALRTTQGNRASAAELLGLSRQSLYVKLRRYGLSDFDSDSEA